MSPANENGIVRGAPVRPVRLGTDQLQGVKLPSPAEQVFPDLLARAQGAGRYCWCRLSMRATWPPLKVFMQLSSV